MGHPSSSDSALSGGRTQQKGHHDVLAANGPDDRAGLSEPSRFENEFPQTPPAKPETDKPKGKGESQTPVKGKRAPGKRNAGKRKPK